MNAPMDPDVMDLAVPYALHALTTDERDDLDVRLARSGEAPAFYAEVRAIRETMATLSAATAIEPRSPCGQRC